MTTELSVTQPSNELITLFKTAGITVNNKVLSATDYVQEALKSRQKSSLLIALSGMYLSKAQEIEGHGFIANEAKRLNIARQTLYNDIDVFNMYARFPQESVQILDNLNSSKILFLKHFDDAELSELINGEQVKGITFDDIQTFPTREIERRLKESQASNNELEQQLQKERAEKELAQKEVHLLRRQNNEVTGFIYPESIERIRIESSVLASQAHLCLDDMEGFISELTVVDDLSEHLEKREAQFSAGGSALYLNLKSIYSRANLLLAIFEQQIGVGCMPDQIEDTPTLTPEEAQRVLSMREVMLAEHEIDRDVRQNSRKTK